MKKNIKLRSWALCLALVMVLTSLVLVNAFANGETCTCGSTYDNGFCGNCGSYQPAVDSDGDGYYEIGNAGQLYWFADYVSNTDSSANAKLTANITVNTGVLNADGYVNSGNFRYWNPINYYYGTFDGQYFTISGLYCSADGYAGLFGYLNEGATVKNVGVLDSYFYGSGDGVGGVVGYNNYGTVQNCYNYGRIYGESQDVGGIVGCNNYGTVQNCYNHGRIYGNEDVGGIVGQNEGAVRNCYSIGQVGADTSWYGGVIGYNPSNSVTNCYYLDSVAYGGRENGAVARTAEEFASGKVAGLLGNAYGQLLGTDDYPVFRTEANTLYPCALCPSKTDGYSNDPDQGNATEHTYEDGMCIYCGEAIPPAQDEDGYYIITTVGELYWFADYVNNKGHYDANAKLGNDITVNENVLDEDGYLNEGEFRVWEPVGSGQWHSDEGEDENGNYYYNEWQEGYTGHFNGQGFTIYGLYCYQQTKSNVGLFGYIGADAKIENVNVADSYFYGRYHTGSIVGYNDGGTVDNCSSDNYVRASYTYEYYEDEWDSWEDYYYGNYTGGIVGTNYGTVKNCSNSGMVRGYSNVGGVVGRNFGIVENCSNSASIDSIGGECDESYYGGIVGYNTEEGVVRNCYNRGTLTSGYGFGGVVGYNHGIVENCYNIGEVYGYHYVGGVVGYSDGTVTNCYYLEGCAEDYNEYGTPKTEAEFASGEVMLLLGEAFGQDLSKGEKWPTLGGPRYTMIVVFTNGEEVYFADLAEAVAAAKEDADCTLIMLADSFKGEALINAGSFNLEFRGKQMNSTLVVAENADITIKNGKFTNITVQNGGKVTINGETVILTGVLKAEDGKITIIEAAVEGGLKLEGIALNEILDRNSFGRNEDGEVVASLSKIRMIRPGASLDEMTITVDDAAYTGEAVTPVVVITIGGKTLVLDEDFVIAALANNKDLGINTAEVTIRAIAPYTGEKTVKFSIVNCATDFDAQIKELEERLKALEENNELSEAVQEAIDEIRAKIAEIQQEYAKAEDLEAAIARIEALEDAIAALENRVSANETAIEQIRQELAQVQEDVMNALNNGNADLAEQIQKLKTVLNMAIAANGAADVEMEAELQVLIREAKATLQIVIDKVAADLEQAKLDVNAAILAGDADLAQKIAALQTAMNVATEVSNAADNVLKAELSDAVATVNAAVAALQNRVETEKERLNSMLVLAIVMAGVVVAGCVGLTVYVIVDKRKLVR